MQDNISDNEKQKILEALNSIRSQVNDHSLHNLIAENHAKLIECRHEIIINVTANVMEEDDEGLTVGSKEICKKNYHIPVPSNKDYNDYLKGFFDFMEECMKSSAEHANEILKNQTKGVSNG